MDGTPGVGTTGFWEGRETRLGGDRGRHTKQLEEQPLERVCRGRAGWSGEHELLATHFVCSGQQRVLSSKDTVIPPIPSLSGVFRAREVFFSLK